MNSNEALAKYEREISQQSAEDARAWAMLHAQGRILCRFVAENDLEQASNLLNEMCDEEYALVGDCESVSELAAALGGYCANDETWYFGEEGQRRKSLEDEAEATAQESE